MKLFFLTCNQCTCNRQLVPKAQVGTNKQRVYTQKLSKNSSKQIFTYTVMADKKLVNTPEMSSTQNIMSRNRDPINLGDARRYASALPPEKQKIPSCKCYKLRCSKNACCCRDKTFGWSCPISCGCCLWTPSCSYFLFDGIIGACMCFCEDDGHSCNDLKGNFYHISPVDVESGTLAYYAENKYYNTLGDNLDNSIFCEPV